MNYKDKKLKKFVSLKVIIIYIFLFMLIVSYILNKSSFKFKKFNNIEDSINVINNLIDKKEEEKNKANKIAVLTFHRITYQETKDKYFKDNEWVESVDMLDKQLNYLYENGYKTLSLDQFYCWYKEKCEFDKKSIVLTIDDGDLSTYYLILPLLKKYKFKATSFIIGSKTQDYAETEYIDDKRQFVSKEEMKKVKKDYPGLEFQNHSYNFHDSNYKNKIYEMTEEELQEDFDQMKQYKFKYMAYPFGNYSDKLIKKLEENNYLLAFTFRNYGYATRNSKRYEIPRFKINGESNVNTVKEIVGGY